MIHPSDGPIIRVQGNRIWSMMTDSPVKATGPVSRKPASTPRQILPEEPASSPEEMPPDAPELPDPSPAEMPGPQPAEVPGETPSELALP